MLNVVGFVYMVLVFPRASGQVGGHGQSGGTFPSATVVDRQSQCAELPYCEVLCPHTHPHTAAVQFQIETPSSSGVSMSI